MKHAYNYEIYEQGVPALRKPIAVVLVLLLTASVFALTSREAEATHTWCGSTTERSSSYTNWGITGFTHSSQMSYCVNGRQIRSVSARINDIKRSSIGFFFLDSTFERTGYTPSSNTWQDHYGRAGWDVTIKGIGFRIQRGHEFNYDIWSTGYDAITWNRSSSSWYLV